MLPPLTPSIKSSAARHRRGAIGICLGLFLLFARGAGAAPFDLSLGMVVVAPVGQAAVLEDPTGSLGTADILAGADDAMFRPLVPNRTALGLTPAVWWLRFQVANPTDAPVEWVMNFPSPLTDQLDIYQVAGGKVTEHDALGDLRPRAARPLPGEGFAAPVTTPPHGTSTIYVRFQNLRGDGLDVYFEVSSLRAYGEKQAEIWVFLGLLLGGGTVVFLYNAVIYLAIRERLYLWYLLYLFFALVVFVAASGLGNQFLWPREGFFREATLPVGTALSLLFVVQFSRDFLGTSRLLPRVDWVLRGLMVYFIVLPIAFFAGHPALAARMNMLGCIALTGLPVLGVYLWLRGQRMALVFTLAWGVWFLTITFLVGRALGWVPTNDYTLRLAWLGILGEAILFALALAARIRILQADKVAAEARERQALERAKETLEARVEERTRELASQHEELRRLNQEKDKFFSIIAHDLRSPFMGVLGLSEWLSANFPKLSAAEVADCLRDLHQSATTLHKLLENLLSWALLQQGKLQFNPEPVRLDPVLDGCIEVFAGAAQEKDLRIERGGAEGLCAVADVPMLETVLRNLLGNAVKYSKTGGQIIVTARPDGAAVEVSISDQGVGMDAATMNHLFELGVKTSAPGTSGEQGTGLGLQLCRELLEASHSKLEVVSKVDEGTTFRFSLPRAEG